MEEIIIRINNLIGMMELLEESGDKLLKEIEPQIDEDEYHIQGKQRLLSINICECLCSNVKKLNTLVKVCKTELLNIMTTKNENLLNDFFKNLFKIKIIIRNCNEEVLKRLDNKDGDETHNKLKDVYKDICYMKNGVFYIIEVTNFIEKIERKEDKFVQVLLGYCNKKFVQIKNNSDDSYIKTDTERVSEEEPELKGEPEEETTKPEPEEKEVKESKIESEEELYGFCGHCRKTVKMINIKKSINKKNIKMSKGNCAICNKAVTVMGI